MAKSGENPYSQVDPGIAQQERDLDRIANIQGVHEMKAEHVEAVARAAHEANRAFCIAIGDLSQLSWEGAYDWQRESAIKGVSVALAGATPAEQHAAWVADKLASGWRYGPTKNPDIKEHPCMVPYDQLPMDQQRKDALYLAVVRAMASALGRVC